MSLENKSFKLELQKATLDGKKLVALQVLLSQPEGIERFFLRNRAGDTVVSSEKKPSPNILQADQDRLAGMLPDEFVAMFVLAHGYFYFRKDGKFQLSHEVLASVEPKLGEASFIEGDEQFFDPNKITLTEVLVYQGLDRACAYLISLIKILKS